MTDEERKKIFSRNLSKYVNQSGLSQKEIADRIKVSPQTFNTWMQGIALPRMGKIQLLADFFHIDKTDLIDNKPHVPQERVAYMIKRVLNDPMLYEMLEIAIEANPSDVELSLAMLKRVTAYQEKLSDIKPKRLSDYKD